MKKIHMKILQRVFSVVVTLALFVTSFLPSTIIPFVPRVQEASAAGYSTLPDPSTWATNGAVTASAIGPDGTLYIGGDFTMVGPNHPGGVEMTGSENDINERLSAFYGATIFTSVSDGNGGWYVGGLIPKYGDQTVHNLAHIRSDSTLDTNFLPEVDMPPFAMALSGTTLYIGGTFTHVNGLNRSYLGAVSTLDGSTTSWDPSASDIVNAMTVSGDTLFVGGDFTQVSASERKFAASFNLSNGSLTSWNPRLDARVRSILVRNSVVYAGGEFTGVNPIQYGAIVGSADNSIPQNTKVNGAVSCVISDNDGGWYVGGSFTSVNGVSRQNLAHILSNGTVDTSFNMGATLHGVSALALSGSTLFLGGAEGLFSDQAHAGREEVAAVNAATGTLLPLNVPLVNNSGIGATIFSMIVMSGTLYVAGNITGNGLGTNRGGIVAINPADGSITSWNPNANGVVRSIYSDGTTLYAGGDFTTIGGQSRNRIAALSISDASATSWDPNANGTVHTVTSDGTTLYAGGDFTTIGGQSRNYIAALDLNTAAATSWDPNANNGVYQITTSGSSVYASGNFTTVNGASHTYFTKISATTGLASSWKPIQNPSGGGTVPGKAISISGSNIFIGSERTLMQALRQGIVAVDIDFGEVLDWNAHVNGQVYTIAAHANLMYIGGLITEIGGNSRPYIGSVDESTAAVTDWNPIVDSNVQAIAFHSNSIIIGGTFSSVNSLPRRSIAFFDVATGDLQATTRNADIGVNTLSTDSENEKTFAGGGFKIFDGLERFYIAAMNPTTGQATDWYPQLDSAVRAIGVQDSRVYLGGYFTTVNSVSHPTLAAVSRVDAALQSWADDGVTGNISVITPTQGGIYIGGEFTAAGGGVMSNLARLDLEVGAADSWYPNPDGAVNTIYVDGANNLVYIGGFFGTVDGVSRNNLAAIPINDAAPTVWSPSTDGAVLSITMSIDRIFVGGTFTEVEGDPRIGLASFDRTSGNYDAAWDTGINAGVSAMHVVGDALYIGGNFTTAGYVERNMAAAINIATAEAVSWSPMLYSNGNLDGLIHGIEIIDGKIFYLGDFDWFQNMVQTWPNMITFEIPTISFTSTSASQSESSTVVTLPLQLSTSSESVSTVDYAVTGGTATGGGVDYTLASGTATIAAGDTSTTIPLTIVNDSIHESDETIVVTLSNPSNNVDLGTNTTYTYTIQDNDVQQYSLSYSAGAHGTISGTASQTVNSGGSGSAVTAVADSGYHFVSWSDTSTANPRTDTNVTNDISVTASFAADPVVVTIPDRYIQLTVTPPKKITPSSVVQYSMKVKSTGKKSVTNIKVSFVVPKNSYLYTLSTNYSTKPKWSCTPRLGAGSTCSIIIPKLNSGSSATAIAKFKIAPLITGVAPKHTLVVNAVSGSLKAKSTTATAITRVHVVQSGQTQSSLAVKYYGKSSLWTKIRDANKAIYKQLTNLKAKLIRGWKLLIP